MAKWLIFCIVLGVAAAGVWLASNTHHKENYVKITGGTPGTPYFGMVDHEKDKTIHFDLVDPEGAPEGLIEQILFGYHIVLETKKNAPKYAGNAYHLTGRFN